MHDSAPPNPAQDLVVEVDGWLEENDNRVDNSDEHMDGVEVMGDIGSGEDDSESSDGSSCGGEVGDYGYEEKKTPGLMRRWTVRRKRLMSLMALQTCNIEYSKNFHLTFQCPYKNYFNLTFTR